MKVFRIRQAIAHFDLWKPMILKFWPRWPRKRPLNLSSLGGRPLDFNINSIFEISGFHWSKWAIACLIRKTFIFWTFSLQPLRLLTNLKNESFPNYTIYSLHFWNQFHWSKCTIECAIYSILILNSAQARGVWSSAECASLCAEHYFFFCKYIVAFANLNRW